MSTKNRCSARHPTTGDRCELREGGKHHDGTGHRVFRRRSAPLVWPGVINQAVMPGLAAALQPVRTTWQPGLATRMVTSTAAAITAATNGATARDSSPLVFES